MPRLSDVVEVMAQWFDPRWAEAWDAVGLVCGDPHQDVRKVLLAIDAVPATVAETAAVGAQLLITHHPLLLTPVHGVAADTPKGALVHRMIGDGVAHLVAHTNADVARPGVSDALGDLLGLAGMTPLAPADRADLDKLVVFVPVDDAPRLIDALSAAGAGAIGAYDRCTWTSEGTGSFRPLPGARPTVGRVGEVETVHEARVEMVLPTARRHDVVAALRAAHPYEEPAFDLLVQAPMPTGRGTGRVGDLPARTSLADFVEFVARQLPRTAAGVKGAGEPNRVVQRVAVCGGSGGSLAVAARAAGADVLVTADVRHHPALETVTEAGPDAMGLVDAAHWATEAPWLDALAPRLRDRLGIDVAVSRVVTDPWTLHADPATSEGAP